MSLERMSAVSFQNSFHSMNPYIRWHLKFLSHKEKRDQLTYGSVECIFPCCLNHSTSAYMSRIQMGSTFQIEECTND